MTKLAAAVAFVLLFTGSAGAVLLDVTGGGVFNIPDPDFCCDIRYLLTGPGFQIGPGFWPGGIFSAGTSGHAGWREGPDFELGTSLSFSHADIQTGLGIGESRTTPFMMTGRRGQGLGVIGAPPPDELIGQ